MKKENRKLISLLMSYEPEEVEEALEIIKKIDVEFNERNKIPLTIKNFLMNEGAVPIIDLQKRFVATGQCTQKNLDETLDFLEKKGFIYKPKQNEVKFTGVKS